MELNYYKILEVPQNATPNEIKRAYRLKAKQLHPDKNNSPNAKALFQILQEAYRTLIQPEKRRWYDFKLQYPSTTNLNQDARRRRPSSNSYSQAYQYRQQHKKEEKTFTDYKKTLADKIFFHLLVIAGGLAILFSLLNLIFVEFDSKYSGGLIFGVWFLFLLIIGWNSMTKK